jgi:hypothetical protein
VTPAVRALGFVLSSITLAACATHPPRGQGGAAELATTTATSPPPYWGGEALHAELRDEIEPARMDLGERWIEDRLETLSCLDFKLEGLSMAGAADIYPAEIALAQADRRRALRAFNGGLPRDGELHLRDYRAHAMRIEEYLLRNGRPVSAELRNLRC